MFFKLKRVNLLYHVFRNPARIFSENTKKFFHVELALFEPSLLKLRKK